MSTSVEGVAAERASTVCPVEDFDAIEVTARLACSRASVLVATRYSGKHKGRNAQNQILIWKWPFTSMLVVARAIPACVLTSHAIVVCCLTCRGPFCSISHWFFLIFGSTAEVGGAAGTLFL